MYKILSFIILFVSPIVAFTQQTGFLDIDSTPSGAQIYINNNYHGQTPNFITLPVGNHTLEVRYQDYESQRLQITIRLNEVNKQTITLREARGFRERPPEDRVIEQARGQLTVITEPAQATVFIDGVEVIQKTPFTIYDVGAGERRIRIQQRMGAPLNDNLEIELRTTIKANETALLRVNLYDYLRTGTLDINTNVSRTEITLRDVTRNRDQKISVPRNMELINGVYEIIWEDTRRQNLRFEIRPGARTNIFLPIQEAYLRLLSVIDHPDYISEEEYIRKNANFLPERVQTKKTSIRNPEIFLLGLGSLAGGSYMMFIEPTRRVGEFKNTKSLYWGIGLFGSGVALMSLSIGANEQYVSIDEIIEMNKQQRELLLQDYNLLTTQWSNDIDEQNLVIRRQNDEIEQRNERLPRATVNYSQN